MIRILLCLLLLAPLSVNAQEHNHDHDEQPTKEMRDKLLVVQPSDIVLGNPETAKVLIIEYASLSCPHCAEFYNSILPAFSGLIDSGEVALAHRHFPLNKVALDGALTVECSAIEDRAKILKSLYYRQRSWAFENDYLAKLIEIGKEFNLDEEDMNACLNDKTLQREILSKQLEARHLKVTSTPTYFFNHQKHSGLSKKEFLDNLRETLDKLKQD